MELKSFEKETTMGVMEIDLWSERYYENFVTLYFEQLTELESFKKNGEIDSTKQIMTWEC